MKFLEEQGISKELIRQIENFVDNHNLTEEMKKRIPKPDFMYYGKDVWEQAIYGILSGENILLVGNKATGKNVLCENLAYVFQRPMWNVSFHINTDSSSLIGTDTFKDGEVVLRKGPIYECAEMGGFGVLDEINMARNDAMSVLHSTLDYRRIIDIPGYDIVNLNKATRFIATMNYGYAGTRDLNEALLSRFLVIQMPAISKSDLIKLLVSQFPKLNELGQSQLAGVFLDILKKNENSEISTKSLDLRGLIVAISLMEMRMTPAIALKMGVVNKCFDEFEAQLVQDTISMRISPKVKASDYFE